MFKRQNSGTPRRRLGLAMAVATTAVAVLAGGVASDAQAAVTLGDGTVADLTVNCHSHWGGKSISFSTYASRSGVQMQTRFQTFDSSGRLTGTSQPSSWVYIGLGSVTSGTAFVAPAISPTTYYRFDVRFYRSGVTSPWYRAGMQTNLNLSGWPTIYSGLCML